MTNLRYWIQASLPTTKDQIWKSVFIHQRRGICDCWMIFWNHETSTMINDYHKRNSDPSTKPLLKVTPPKNFAKLHTLDCLSPWHAFVYFRTHTPIRAMRLFNKRRPLTRVPSSLFIIYLWISQAQEISRRLSFNTSRQALAQVGWMFVLKERTMLGWSQVDCGKWWYNI